MTPSDLLGNGFARIPALIELATSGLSARQLAISPAHRTNSVAWLAWHTARGQDAWVSDLEGTEPVWTAEKWNEAFALPFSTEENGFGMPEEDTSLVVATSELLVGYLEAVTARTLAYLTTLEEVDLDDIVDATRQPAITRGVQLCSILDDGLQHAGQAGYARGILDRS